jgi:hypothetical protein
MADGYKALTEKEKQTLRLLLGGHEARSRVRVIPACSPRAGR